MAEVLKDSARIRAGSRVSEIADQLYVLTASDLRSRYGRGLWRPLKWLVDPFALVGVYLLMVLFIFTRRPEAPGLSLACAVVPFQLILMTLTNSLDAVRVRRSIVANMQFPRILLPVSTALTEAVGFAASLVLLMFMMAVYGVAPTFAVLWVLPALAVTFVFGVAVAYPGVLLGVWAPDLRGLILSGVRAAYFLAPGLVALSSVQGATQTFVRLNPFTGLFEAMRHALLYGTAPPAWQLLYPLGFALLLLAVFVPIYQREQAHFAKVLE